MGGQDDNRLSAFARAIDRRIDRFFAGRGRRRRARVAAELQKASEFLKPIDGGGYEGWARTRTGFMHSTLDRLVLTPAKLTFAPGNAKHERTVALADILDVSTNGTGMRLRVGGGGTWQLSFAGNSSFDAMQGDPRPLADAWAEAIRAMVTGREPSFAHEPAPGEIDRVESAFNRVFDWDALDTAPVRGTMPFRAIGYPFEWTLTPSQEERLRAVCRELGEKVIGCIQTEYGRDRWEVVVEGSLYANAGALSIPHAFVSLEGRWGLWLTSRWFAVLACENEEMLAVFERAMPEFGAESVRSLLRAREGDTRLKDLVRHVYGRTHAQELLETADERDDL